MWAYIVRRLLQGIPTVLGVLMILFVLFNLISTPERIAKNALGPKATETNIKQWVISHGYDKPALYNKQAKGWARITDTRIYNYFKNTLTFDFGDSDLDHRSIRSKIAKGFGPSLCLTFPMLVMGLVLGVGVALVVALYRGTYIDRLALVLCVVGMSLVIFVYIMGGQYLFGKILRWFPISGWSPEHRLQFLLMPVVVGVLGGLGESVRFYRTIMVNEISSDYIRTARAKGTADRSILFKHLLKNAMIPVLTRLVMAILFLFMGSLLLENFFGIPGLGNLTVEAIRNQDFPTISAMVYISALIYIAGNILVDISYTFVDPRVRLD